MLCLICKENAFKYKCPKCLVKYCSVPCYKVHKETCRTEEAPSEPRLPEPNSTARILSGRHGDDEGESGDRVRLEALDKLGDSEELRRMLGNPHLQRMLRHLDCSDRAEKDLEAAMKEPIFTEFVDQCLEMVEPSQQTET